MTNIKQFPKKDSLPDNCKNTEIYLMHEVLYNEDRTKTVTDFETGDQRNRRWGAVLSFSIFPKFDEVSPNGGPLLLPKMPSRFVAGDSIEEVKARMVYELNKAFDMAELSVKDPAAFLEKAKQLAEKAGQNTDTV